MPRTLTGRPAPILPVSKKLILEFIDDGSWSEETDIVYIINDENRESYLAVISAGELGSDWDIGTNHTFIHDQTRKLLGHGEVIDIVPLDSFMIRVGYKNMSTRFAVFK